MPDTTFRRSRFDDDTQRLEVEPRLARADEAGRSSTPSSDSDTAEQATVD